MGKMSSFFFFFKAKDIHFVPVRANADIKIISFWVFLNGQVKKWALHYFVRLWFCMMQKELHKSAFWLQTDANVVNSDECCWF